MKTTMLCVLIMALITLASCNCKMCNKDGYKINLCRDKYDTTQEFENDITFMEGEGYNCQ